MHLVCGALKNSAENELLSMELLPAAALAIGVLSSSLSLCPPIYVISFPHIYSNTLAKEFQPWRATPMMETQAH